MATTNTSQPRSLTRVKIDTAFGSMAETFSLPKVAIETLFATIAKDCTTAAERWLYLQTCKANALNPLMKQLYANKRGGQLVLTVSYYVFTSRAKRDGYITQSSPVFEKDTWGGWDAVAGRPISHVAPLSRGSVVGAWARATPMDGKGEGYGAFYPLSELLPPPLWGNDSPKWRENKVTPESPKWDLIRAGAYGPMWSKMPGRMAEKCAVAHVCRRVTPDLEALYTPEELLGEESPRETPISELAEADVVGVSDAKPEPEAKTAGQQLDEAAQSAAAQPAETETSASSEKSIDERLLEVLSVKDDADRNLLRAVRERLEPARLAGKEKGPRTDEQKKKLLEAIDAVQALRNDYDAEVALQAVTSTKGPDVAADIREYAAKMERE